MGISTLVVGHEAAAEWPWEAPLCFAPRRTTNPRWATKRQRSGPGEAPLRFAPWRTTNRRAMGISALVVGHEAPAEWPWGSATSLCSVAHYEPTSDGDFRAGSGPRSARGVALGKRHFALLRGALRAPGGPRSASGVAHYEPTSSVTSSLSQTRPLPRFTRFPRRRESLSLLPLLPCPCRTPAGSRPGGTTLSPPGCSLCLRDRCHLLAFPRPPPR